jgi:hypothetical protein
VTVYSPDLELKSTDPAWAVSPTSVCLENIPRSAPEESAARDRKPAQANAATWMRTGRSLGEFFMGEVEMKIARLKSVLRRVAQAFQPTVLAETIQMIFNAKTQRCEGAKI